VSPALDQNAVDARGLTVEIAVKSDSGRTNSETEISRYLRFDKNRLF